MRIFRNFIYSGFAVFLALSSCKVPETTTPGEDAKDVKGKEPVTEVKVPEFIEESCRVYSGSDGIVVIMANTKDGRSFLQTARTGSVVDGRVLPCEINRRIGGHEAWLTQFDGEKKAIFTKAFKRFGAVVYRLWPPNMYIRGGIPVSFDKEMTEKASTQALVDAYRKQMMDGSLAKIQEFDEEKRIREEEELVQTAVDEVKKRCFFTPEYSLQWKSIEKRDPEHMTLHRDCRKVFTEVVRLCGYDHVGRFLRDNLKKVVCKRADKLQFELSEGTLTFGYPLEVRDFWKELRKKFLDELRWPDGRNLARVFNESRTQVCTDGKGKYVGLKYLHDQDKYISSAVRRLFYGNDKELRMLPPRKQSYGEGWFFDPRYKMKVRRSYLVHVSRTEIDTKTKSCVLRCGKHETKLRLLSQEKSMNLMKNAKMKEPLARRKPYGLARDRRGIYYYVDMAESEQVKDYRLYRGPLGNLKRMKMTNIVSDSQGDVFATPDGKLRLVLEKEHSFWMRGKKKEKLINVPIEKNYTLIFNDLGVYLGKPYGTPCDIF